MADYKEIIEVSKKIIKSRKISSEDKLTIAINFLGALKVEYEDAKDVFEKRKYCYIAIDYIKPAIEIELNRKNIDEKLFFQYCNLYEELVYFCARKSFRYFLIAIEFRKMKKIWEIRLDLFEPLIFYLEEMYFNKLEMELIRASFPPRIW